MPRDVVLVPTHNRPEFLALCLEHLSACSEIADKEVWIRPESRGLFGRFWDETREVIRQNAGRLDIRLMDMGQHSYVGNSYNVLVGYKEAYAFGAKRIYLVEDDVLVAPDFFRWHDAMFFRHAGLFCSIGWHCLRRGDVPRPSVPDPWSYFLSKEDYASIGVCWPRDMLAHVVCHATNNYFDHPVEYLRSHFPNDPLSLDFSEQDGLIMRVLGSVRAPVAWPIYRRCSHVGWYGYHRPDGPRPVGDLPDKIREARRIVHDEELLRKCGRRFGGDTETVVEHYPLWCTENLRQIQVGATCL